MSNVIDLAEVAQFVSQRENINFGGKVGGGGFKETFKVTTKDGGALALKIFRPDGVSERTEREIESMQRCSHPRIAKIHSIMQIKYKGENFTILTEEFIGGGTLNNRLQTNGYFNKESIIDLGNQLFDVIGYISELGLIHRDIKPDNILFRDNGSQIVVTDFGIVRDLNAESLTATYLPSGPGTVGFMAPEQMRNLKAQENWRTDQFSCGIVLSICFLGVHPYGSTLAEAVKAINSFGHTTVDFRTRVKDTGFIALEKMVNAHPVKRYRTISDLIEAWNSQGV